MRELRIGISGWTYPPWRGVFYPRDLVQKHELAFASRQVNAIEINGSFYSLQTPASYARWRDATPPGFLFAIKAPRFITHLKRLRDIETPLANFFASGLFALREKIGPLLWQFPPNFAFDEKRFETFFQLLPRDTRAAAKLARRHDAHVAGRALTRIDRNRPLHHVLEVRHPSFVSEAYIALLRRYDIGSVIADTAGRWPFMEDITSDTVYIRLHGDEELYVSGYTEKALCEWARKIRVWHRGGTPAHTRLIASRAARAPQGRAVFVFFDNDVKVRAPHDAMQLAHKLGITPKPVSKDPFPDVPEVPRVSWPPVSNKKRSGKKSTR